MCCSTFRCFGGRGDEAQRLHEQALVPLAELVEGQLGPMGDQGPHLLVVRRAVRVDQELVARVEVDHASHGRTLGHRRPPAPQREHALDEVLAQHRVVQPSLLLHRQQREAAHEQAGEDPTPRRTGGPPPPGCPPTPARGRGRPRAGGRRGGRGYTRTRSMPLDGESFLKTKPQRSSAASCSRRSAAQAVMRSVTSSPVVVTTSRGAAGSPTRRIGGRGTPNPVSTSGHTGTHSTQRPSVSTRKASRLAPPSQRTGCPSRQLLMPRRMGPFIAPRPPAGRGPRSSRGTRGPCAARGRARGQGRAAPASPRAA